MNDFKEQTLGQLTQDYQGLLMNLIIHLTAVANLEMLPNHQVIRLKGPTVAMILKRHGQWVDHRKRAVQNSRDSK